MRSRLAAKLFTVKLRNQSPYQFQYFECSKFQIHPLMYRVQMINNNTVNVDYFSFMSFRLKPSVFRLILKTVFRKYLIYYIWQKVSLLWKYQIFVKIVTYRHTIFIKKSVSKMIISKSMRQNKSNINLVHKRLPKTVIRLLTRHTGSKK